MKRFNRAGITAQFFQVGPLVDDQMSFSQAQPGPFLNTWTSAGPSVLLL